MVKSYYPIIYDYSRIQPPQTVVKEEHQTPDAFPVKKLLLAHIRKKLAAQQHQIVDKREVNDCLTALGICYPQSRSIAEEKTGSGEFGPDGACRSCSGVSSPMTVSPFVQGR